MNYSKIIYTIDKASQNDILNHLRECDKEFVPPLHQKVNIAEYVNKIFNNATTFEAWVNNKLTGLVAAYFNNREKKTAFITNVSVTPDNYGSGIAKELLNKCVTYGIDNKITNLKLEVYELNTRAMNLYKQMGFEIVSQKDCLAQMEKHL